MKENGEKILSERIFERNQETNIFQAICRETIDLLNQFFEGE